MDKEKEAKKLCKEMKKKYDEFFILNLKEKTNNNLKQVLLNIARDIVKGNINSNKKYKIYKNELIENSHYNILIEDEKLITLILDENYDLINFQPLTLENLNNILKEDENQKRIDIIEDE
ncbi:hypothetical protein FTT16_08830 [Campylobacter jejuni]|nr:hypothetical protein [Campylobacter jejuni]